MSNPGRALPGWGFPQSVWGGVMAVTGIRRTAESLFVPAPFIRSITADRPC